MCDTMVVLPSASADGKMLFGKNSDRERNEAQRLCLVPAQDYPAGAMLQATYIAIPQVAHTHAVLLSQPFWMWGAEMGANEHGVAIGNEAVHSRIAPQTEKSLIGMDLLRLALERAATASEALSVITGLLERWGQGGNCGHLNPHFYHNAFLIADPREAFVLETVGRTWVVESAAPVRAISNAYSIHAGFSQASASLPAEAAQDFAAAFADPVLEQRGFGAARCARATSLLQVRAGAVGVRDIMAVLRDHGPQAEGDPDWHPQDTVGRTICMHAADHDRRGQTTGSWVSMLDQDGAVHWVTGTAAPCTSIFKPVLLSAGLPAQGPAPTDRFDVDTLWWRHELLHRRLLSDPGTARGDFAAERNALEAGFVARIAQVADRESVESCWQDADAFEARWLAAIGTPPPRTRPDYAAAWRDLNQLAMMPA